MARWWWWTAARICAARVRRISCNGPMRSGRSSGRRDRKTLDEGRSKRILDVRFLSPVTAFPKRHFPAIHRPHPSAACETMSGHHPVTIMKEPELVMSVPRILTALVASVLMCGGAHLAQAQNAAPKAAKGAAKPAPSKPEAAKPDAKPAAAVAGNAEPTLIGQFGTWGAYTATPKGKKVCFALAKPAASKTNP